MLQIPLGRIPSVLWLTRQHSDDFLLWWGANNCFSGKLTAYLDAAMLDEVYVKLPAICGDNMNSWYTMYKTVTVCTIWSSQSWEFVECGFCEIYAW